MNSWGEVCLIAIKAGDLLRLKKDALPHARVREFYFVKMDGQKVILAHPDGSYEWIADIDDIDWNGFTPPVNS